MEMKLKEKNLLSLQKTAARIGLFGVGYDKYWEQFPGLLEELMHKHEVILQKFSDNKVTVIDFGMVDNPARAYTVVKELEAANLDMVFCNMLTYATSGTFGIIIKTLSIPVVLVALQPLKALDYSKASTYMQLANDDICSLPEFAGVAVRMGKSVPDVIIGVCCKPKVTVQIFKYAVYIVCNQRIGIINHVVDSRHNRIGLIEI